jgi:DNA-binding MarR family transcriptional regulator
MAPAEGELLRLVDERPGLGVREAAAALRLAPNTVSSLVGRLVHTGLVARDRDPSDARAVRLRTTAAARRRMARWQDRNAELLDAALARLDAGERAAIEGSLGALMRLAEVIEAMDGGKA